MSMENQPKFGERKNNPVVPPVVPPTPPVEPPEVKPEMPFSKFHQHVTLKVCFLHLI